MVPQAQDEKPALPLGLKPLDLRRVTSLSPWSTKPSSPDAQAGYHQATRPLQSSGRIPRQTLWLLFKEASERTDQQRYVQAVLESPGPITRAFAFLHQLRQILTERDRAGSRVGGRLLFLTEEMREWTAAGSLASLAREYPDRLELPMYLRLPGVQQEGAICQIAQNGRLSPPRYRICHHTAR